MVSKFRHNQGFTVIELMIVVAIIGILLAISVPAWLRARTHSQAQSCQENLVKIDGAKSQWAMEKKKGPLDLPVDADLYGETLYLRASPRCPSGGTYALNVVITHADCTYSSLTDFPHVFP